VLLVGKKGYRITVGRKKVIELRSSISMQKSSISSIYIQGVQSIWPELLQHFSNLSDEKMEKTWVCNKNSS
jgi:hypothetical protein